MYKAVNEAFVRLYMQLYVFLSRIVGMGFYLHSPPIALGMQALHLVTGTNLAA